MLTINKGAPPEDKVLNYKDPVKCWVGSRDAQRPGGWTENESSHDGMWSSQGEKKDKETVVRRGIVQKEKDQLFSAIYHTGD